MARDETHVDVELAGRTVRVTSPDKVMFPERGETKLDVVRYYESVEGPLMRAMGGRPVLMERYPHGVEGSSFFQKRVPKDAPDWLETTIVSTPNGTTSRALVAADLAHVAWAVNLGCLGFHVWPNLASDDDHADELRIDLDPQPGVGFEEVRAAAHEVRALLDDVGIEGWPKTTGNRGIHVYVRLEPRWSPIEVRAAAVAVARELARRRTDLITDAWWKEERGERVFIDFNQNAPHKTVFGAWSVQGAAGRAGVDAVRVGRARRRPPRRPHDGDGAPRVAEQRRPVGRRRRATAIARTAARDVRARPRVGTDRRAVAARLPEDARRAAAGCAEQGEEGREGAGRSVTALDAPLRGDELIDDPYPFYARLRRDAPVWQVPGTEVYFVATLGPRRGGDESGGRLLEPLPAHALPRRRRCARRRRGR